MTTTTTESESSEERDLNMRVTDAILKAERLEEGSEAAIAQWLMVAMIEQRLVEVTRVGSLARSIAMRGAVTALMSAGKYQSAYVLAGDYLRELDWMTVTELAKLRDEAISNMQVQTK